MTALSITRAGIAAGVKRVYEKKVVPENYPPEEGCFLRGNDNSPVAVVVILKWHREKTPPEIESLVRAGIESSAALSGTLQTENIGLEKVICNIIANPNIRRWGLLRGLFQSWINPLLFPPSSGSASFSL